MEVESIGQLLDTETTYLACVKSYIGFHNLCTKSNRTQITLVQWAVPPDRPFHNFRASTSGDRQILCGSGTSCDWFWSSETPKCSVGIKTHKLWSSSTTVYRIHRAIKIDIAIHFCFVSLIAPKSSTDLVLVVVNLLSGACFVHVRGKWNSFE